MAARLLYAAQGESQVDEESMGCSSSSSSSEEQESPRQRFSTRVAAGAAVLFAGAAVLGVAAASYHGRVNPAAQRELQLVQTNPAAAPPTASQWTPASAAASAASQPVPPELIAAQSQLPQIGGSLNDYFNQGMGHFVKANPCPEGEEMFSGLCYKSCAAFTNGTLTFRQSAFMCCNFAGKPKGPDNSPSPHDAMSDAGCESGEELFGGLCYKKCSDLSGGKAPYRTSAVTCCPDVTGKQCGMTDVKHDIGFCSGYSVSADGKSCPHAPGKCDMQKGLHLCGGYGTAGDGKSCPHTPGQCLGNEEMHLNQCYKKCSLLTNNSKPYRMSPWTCCVSKSISCLSPTNSDTTTDFAVSGGSGDNDASTPNQLHGPIASQQ